MVSTPELCTYNIPMTPNLSAPTKNHSPRKPLCPFSEAMDVKHKTAVHRLGAAKAKLESIKTGNVLW